MQRLWRPTIGHYGCPMLISACISLTDKSRTTFDCATNILTHTPSHNLRTHFTKINSMLSCIRSASRFAISSATMTLKTILVFYDVDSNPRIL